MSERKVKAFVHMYLPTIDPQWGWFSIWVTGFLLLSSLKEILRLTVTPCWKLPFALLKFRNAIRELDTKKIQAIGKLKNLTMVYKWRNIEGQVAHHSRGTWGLEGDHGLGATNLTSKSVYPTMTAVNSVYTRHLTETNGLFPYVYRTSGELRQAKTVRGRCPSDGPVYPCKTDTVSSPRYENSAEDGDVFTVKTRVLTNPGHYSDFSTAALLSGPRLQWSMDTTRQRLYHSVCNQLQWFA